MYNATVGVYLVQEWDADYFTFEKLATGNGELVNGWANTGEDFDEWIPENDATEAIPESFVFEGIYPNPFNPSTILSFQLQVASKVNLSVYDISGRQIAQLIDGYRDAGIHEVTFDASNLASGIYLYRLTAGSFNASGKMVLVK